MGWHTGECEAKRKEGERKRETDLQERVIFQGRLQDKRRHWKAA
jgi:hypothetical protein